MLRKICLAFLTFVCGQTFAALVPYQGKPATHTQSASGIAAASSGVAAASNAPAPTQESHFDRLKRLMPKIEAIKTKNQADMPAGVSVGFPYFEYLKAEDKEVLCELFGTTPANWATEQPKQFKNISRALHPDRNNDPEAATLLMALNSLRSDFENKKNLTSTEFQKEVQKIIQRFLIKTAAITGGVVLGCKLLAHWAQNNIKRSQFAHLNLFGACAASEQEFISLELNTKTWSIPAWVRWIIRTPQETRARLALYEKLGTQIQNLSQTCSQYYSPTLYPKILTMINTHIREQMPHNGESQNIDLHVIAQKLHLLSACLHASHHIIARDHHFTRIYREHVRSVKRLPRKTVDEQIFYQQTLNQLEDHIVSEMYKMLHTTHVVRPAQPPVNNPTEPNL